MTATAAGLETLRRAATDPARALAALRVDVRRSVEGLLGGLHASRLHGASAVFAEHHAYRPGDEPRWIDWRASARADRVVVRRFEQESRLRAELLLDVSASMHFAGCAPEAGAPSKAWHAAVLLGTLGWLLRQQGDAIGGGTFSETPGPRLPARQHPEAWNQLTEAFAERLARGASTVAGEGRTPALEVDAAGTMPGPASDAAAALGEALESHRDRGLIVLASDLLLPLETLGGALRAAGQLGHEVWVLHVLHPDELRLPAVGPSWFFDPEGGARLLADPAEVADAYGRRMAGFLDEARRLCRDAGARYVCCPVQEPPEATLARLLTGEG